MEASNIIQTGFRMEARLYESLKRKARSRNQSVNAYVVEILEAAAHPPLPRLKMEDFPIEEDFLQIGNAFGEITEEDLINDPKLAYLLSK